MSDRVTPRPDPLFVPTLVDRPDLSDARPWRLESLFLLAFFGGGAASAWISAKNAARLGMPARECRRMRQFGIGFVVVTGAILGCLAGHLSALENTLTPGDFAEIRMQISKYRLLTPLASLGLAAILVRRQVRSDRLYQLDTKGPDGYDSLWRPGLGAALISVAATCAVIFATYTIWRSLG